MTRPPFTDPRDVSEALGIDFSEQQRAAIGAPLEPGVIIAGAGSGKTTVMAARVVWLVGSGQLRPDQVLGLTFTRKAAAELSTRVRTALERAGVLSRESEEGEELILTYDAYAGRLVREHGMLLGLDGDGRLITGAARYRLASRVVSDAQGPFRYLSRLRPGTVTERVLALDSELRSHLVDPSRLAEHAATFLAEVDAAPLNPRGAVYAALASARAIAEERLELAGLVADYAALKERMGFLEYADQMALAARLATEVPQVGIGQRESFAVVLLDEYQDTSSAQATLLRSLYSGPTPAQGRGHPVTAVGDPCQAIYGWRGAAASNILEFAAAFPTADGRPANRFALTVNRRSGQRILDAANHLAGPVRRDPALAAHGLDLDLVAPEGTPPGEVEVAVRETWPEEVGQLADRVASLQASGQVSRWSQVAVLARRNAHVADVYTALCARDVPAEIVGLGGLLDLPPVADVVATLSLLDDVTANGAALRLLTSPRWAIGIPDLMLLGRRARELAEAREEQSGDSLGASLAGVLAAADVANAPSLLEAVEDPGEQPYSAEALARFAMIGREMRELRRHAGAPVVDLAQLVIASLGLEVELAVAAGSGLGGGGALSAFVHAVAGYCDIDGEASLTGLLAYLQAEREYGVGLEQPIISDEDSVKLLTVHKAKGLEWDVVFLPALAGDVFPTDRVTANWLRNAAILPAALRGDAVSVPQLGSVTHKAFLDYGEALTVDQRLSEDRLAYVAVTRARRLLIASTHIWSGDLVRPRSPSAYFAALAERSQVEVEPPAVAGQNPLVGPPSAVAWPDIPQGEALQVRQEVAERVRSARAVISGTGFPPELPSVNLDEAATVAHWDSLIDALAGEAELAGRRLRHVPLPDHLSVTGVSRATADPSGFAAELARPMPRLVSASQRTGLAFHRWLERRHRVGNSTLLDDDDLDLAPERDPGFDTLRAAFEAGPYADLVPLAVEAPFTLVLGGRLVRGRIDAVFPGQDGFAYQIVDWKTGNAQGADPLQLALYRLAWAELQGVDPNCIDAVFYDPRTDRVVRPSVLPGRDRLEVMVAALGGSG